MLPEMRRTGNVAMIVNVRAISSSPRLTVASTDGARMNWPGGAREAMLARMAQICNTIGQGLGNPLDHI
jgi:hypothetical protein